MSSTPFAPWGELHDWLSGKQPDPGTKYGTTEAGRPITTFGQYMNELVASGRAPLSAAFQRNQMDQALIPGAGFENIAANANAQGQATLQGAAPDYNALKKQFAEQSANIEKQYVNTSRALDPAAYAAAMRGHDVESKAAIDAQLASQARYEKEILPGQLGNVMDMGSRLGKQLTMGSGGFNSSVLPTVGRAVTTASLPFLESNARWRTGLMGEYVNEAQRQKGTEDSIQRITQANSQTQLNLELQRLQTLGAPQQLIQQIAGNWMELQRGVMSNQEFAAKLQQAFGPTSFWQDMRGGQIAQQGIASPNIPSPNLPNV